jgi:hypothetical protein
MGMPGRASRNEVTVGAPSRAGSLPHLTVCSLLEIGRLSGRHRWQASSHSGIGCRQLEIGRPSGRLREQARSHSWIECRQLVIGRLGGRYREQAHSYRKAKADRTLFTTQQDERKLGCSS